MRIWPPVWWEERQKLRWQQVLPVAAAALAVLCVGYWVVSCLGPGRPNVVGTEEEVRFYRSLLDTGDAAARAGAMRALAEMGDRASLPALRKGLADDEPLVVAAACVALGKLNDQASAEAIRGLLGHENPEVSAGAAEGAGMLRDQAAVEPLIKLLETTNARPLLAAIVALGQIGDPAAAKPLERLKEAPFEHLDPIPSDDEKARLEEAIAQALERVSAPR